MARPNVSDQEFDFKAPQRREAKPFEPPPWEQEAFEQLQQRKAEEVEEPAAEPDHPKAGEPSVEPVGQEAQEQEPAEEQEPEPKLDEKRVIEMMAQLAEQEPKLHEKTWKPALFSAMLVAALGVMMTIWGIAAMVRTREAGLTAVAGALVLMGFGLGFVAIAAWIGVRTLRQRGVL